MSENSRVGHGCNSCAGKRTINSVLQVLGKGQETSYAKYHYGLEPSMVVGCGYGSHHAAPVGSVLVDYLTRSCAFVRPLAACSFGGWVFQIAAHFLRCHRLA